VAERDDVDRLSTWHDLVLAAHLLDTALERQSQRDGGLSHSHFKILILLAGVRERRLPLSELSRSLRFSISRISHAVSALQRAGLVERRPLAGGRRSYEAVITARGRDTVRTVLRAQSREIRDPLLDAIGRDGEQKLAQIASIIVATLDRELADTPD
jgi:DNA-binding MarR family transcriptional regulator